MQLEVFSRPLENTPHVEACAVHLYKWKPWLRRESQNLYLICLGICMIAGYAATVSVADVLMTRNFFSGHVQNKHKTVD